MEPEKLTRGQRCRLALADTVAIVAFVVFVAAAFARIMEPDRTFRDLFVTYLIDGWMIWLMALAFSLAINFSRERKAP